MNIKTYVEDKLEQQAKQYDRRLESKFDDSILELDELGEYLCEDKIFIGSKK